MMKNNQQRSRTMTAEQKEKMMSLVEHLSEMRKRLVRCAAVFLIAFLACTSKAEVLTELLMNLSTDFSFVYLAPSELLLVYLKMALIGGLIFALPVILLEIWRFIRPGLSRRETTAFTVSLLAGLCLFIVGALFCYRLVLPISIQFLSGLGSTGRISSSISIESYIGFVMTMLIVFGAVFEMPIVILALTSLGVVNPKMLRKQRKFVIVIIFFVAAVITPPDVTTQVMIALPMLGLFEISTLLSGVIFCRKLRRQEQEEAELEESGVDACLQAG